MQPVDMGDARLARAGVTRIPGRPVADLADNTCRTRANPDSVGNINS